MAGWGRVVAGVVLGVAGTVYATNEEVRKNLPKAARDLPENVRRRYQSAVSAAREASKRRREEILRDLEEHGASHPARGVAPTPSPDEQVTAPPVERTTETHD
ncbi:MAG: hypothetical protein M3151_11280 [Actinomycetota bacterium]|nr:hypothetical protein [Actinomycetota bacterium]